MLQWLCFEENCCHHWYFAFNFSGVAHVVWWPPFLPSWVSSILQQFFWQLTLTSVRWEHPVWLDFVFSRYHEQRHLETLLLKEFQDSGIWQCSCCSVPIKLIISTYSLNDLGASNNMIGSLSWSNYWTLFTPWGSETKWLA